MTRSPCTDASPAKGPAGSRTALAASKSQRRQREKEARGTKLRESRARDRTVGPLLDRQLGDRADERAFPLAADADAVPLGSMSEPAGSVIFWVMLPDGVLWINFFSK